MNVCHETVSSYGRRINLTKYQAESVMVYVEEDLPANLSSSS